MSDRRHIRDLRIALEGERRATTHARAARHHADALIDQALTSGMSYDQIARITLKLRLGRAPTVKERQREIDNLRHRRRRAMTGCHGKVAAIGLKAARPAVGSSSEVKTMAERLIRRKIVEEEFISEEPDDEQDDCADDTKVAAAGDDDDDDGDEEEDEGDED